MARILMVTPEAAPFAKTGGLAEVLGSLPSALAALGDEVAVVMPRYGTAPIHGAQRIWHSMPITVGPHSYTVAIDQVTAAHGARYLFVDYPPLYDRAGIYGEGVVDYPDNPLRFALLNQAAIAIGREIFRPDVFHGHDWPAGLLGPYLREMLKGDPTFFDTKIVQTIHNIGYQGNYPAAIAAEVGLDARAMHPGGAEFWGQLSFLKAGIAWADAVTTVSPTYAREIQTPEFGYGMEGLLAAKGGRVVGILNGADYQEWNPAADPHIAAKYSAADLSGKAVAKKALLQEFGLPVTPARPLIGIVSRFAYQKGFDLLAPVVEQLMTEQLMADRGTSNFALVALGSGEEAIEQSFRDLARAYPRDIAVQFGYDHPLAHRIFAGSSLFLMPSRYEPCGLGQIYALRYGTVPVVRATGWLEDTVDETIGFKFHEHTPEALLGSLRAAFDAWKNQKRWQELMLRGMRKDFSWDASAAEYQKLYRSL